MKEGLAQSVGSGAKSISLAIESAFDILGPVNKQRLFQYLRENSGIDVWSATTSNLNQINYVMTDLFGESTASLLMNLLHAEIDKV